MKGSERDEFIIEQYKNDEQMMVLIFAQYCINNDLDPYDVYQEAYPEQGVNPAIATALEDVLPKKESEEIPLELVQYILQVFGNDDLAFILQKRANARRTDE